MLIANTPFQLMQNKVKQRKQSFINRIQTLQLSKQTISYNAKGIDSKCPKKSEQKEKGTYGKIEMNNSIKKSYYYRRLLNKSVDTHLTPEDFVQMKNKFDKINIKDISGQNKSIQFRQLCQSQNERLIRSSQQRYIEPFDIQQRIASNKTNNKDKSPYQKKQKTIIEIAEQRRGNVKNLQLQILGNMIGKDNFIKGRDKTKIINHSYHFEKRQYPIEQQSLSKSMNQQYNCLFKQFSEEKQQQIEQSRGLFITKLRHSMNQEPTNYNLKRISMREYEPLLLRSIQSSQRPASKVSLSRTSKPTSSKQKRVFKNKRPLPIFINDIRGWISGQQNQEETLQTIYR